MRQLVVKLENGLVTQARELARDTSLNTSEQDAHNANSGRTLADASGLSLRGGCLRLSLRLHRRKHLWMLLIGRVQQRPMAFLEGPAMLAPQIREVELPFDFACLSMAIKTSCESIVGDDSSMWSFNMRRLSVVLDRSSQADLINLCFNWWRESHSRPGFRTFSELRPDQNPEASDSLGHCLPSK
eukprot:1158642-Amphidinium_carterae.1